MKKHLLLAAMAVLGTTSYATTPAVSPAPVDGEWAEGTNWLVWQSGHGYYVSIGDDYVDDGGDIKLTNTNIDYSDEGLWCVVGDDENGYTFYNKAAGANQFLGIYGSEDAARCTMWAENELDESVTTKFWFQSTTSGDPWTCIVKYGTDNDTFNRRGEYLALWNSGWAFYGDTGSNFTFTSLTEYIEDTTTACEEAIAGDAESKYFKLQADAKAKIEAYLALEAPGMADALAVEEALSAQKLVCIEDDITVVLGNLLHTSSYVKTSGEDASGSGSLDWSAVWTIKLVADEAETETDGEGEAEAQSDEEGETATETGATSVIVKLYNEYTGKYMGAINNVSFDTRISLVDEENACSYELTNAAGTFAANFYDTSCTDGYGDYAYLHMVNWDALVRWTAAADASQFTIIDFDESWAAGWAADLIETVPTGNKVGLPVLTEENEAALNTAVATLEATPASIEAYKALATIINDLNTITDETELVYPEVGKWYTIRGAVYTDKYIVEDYDNQTDDGYNKAVPTTLGTNSVPAMWQFVPCTDEGNEDLYIIKAANSGDVFQRASYGGTMGIIDIEDTDLTVGKYDLFNTDHRSNGGITIVAYTNDERSDRVTVTMKTDFSGIESWNAASDDNCWFVELAETVVVTLGSAGYATVCYPFAVTLPEDLAAYTAAENAEGTEVVLTKIESKEIAANTAVALVGEADCLYTLTINYDSEVEAVAEEGEEATEGEGAAEEVVNQLQGTLAPKDVITGVVYVLSGDKFVAEQYQVKANTAYITSDVEGEKAVVVAKDEVDNGGEEGEGGDEGDNGGEEGEGGEEGSINEISTEDAAGNVIYDLSGRRVAKAVKGVYIINGQKVVVK